MGFFDRFVSPDLKAFIELEARTAASLPPDWRYHGMEIERLGSIPASHWVHAACAETPDAFVAALAQDNTAALHELMRLASGHAPPTTGWALPPMTFKGAPRASQRDRSPAPDHEAQMVARAAAEACLPAGSVLSVVDTEAVGPGRMRLFNVSAHLPDGTGLAAVATTGPGAYETLAARLKGEIASTPTWTICQAAAGPGPGVRR
ncbi:hypothetical protein [Nocardioides sp.]|uniref:hypothetical protein n=1 Tax=Nocardioides sp. TaxID=35761 RepID=UPI002B7DA810|nr:hypothetical protein [Nocardioides sp.]HXH77675.1 hypothetical protein [Nocardioides sp.]